MKKIAILVCGEVAKTCTANGCLKAVNSNKDAFERYSDEASELASFAHCNGCDTDPIEQLNVRIDRFKKASVEVVHLSTCIRGRCQHYEAFAKKLSKHFEVVGYTHGSAEGKKGNTINLKKKKFLKYRLK